MTIQIRVSEDSKQEIDAVAKEKGIQPGEAADFLIQVGASRRRALAKYAAAQGGTTKSEKPKKAKKAKAAKAAKGEKKAKAAKAKAKGKNGEGKKAKRAKAPKNDAPEVEELSLN